MDYFLTEEQVLVLDGAMGTMTPNPVRSAVKYFGEDFRRPVT